MARFLIVVAIATIFLFLILGNMEVHAIKCYVCKDCDLHYNDSLIVECAEEEEKCLKREMINEEVERSCGTADDCKVGGGADPKKPKKTNSESSANNKGRKPRRFVRQLLQASTKEEDVDPVETAFTSLHCCNEDECNGALSTFKLAISTQYSILALILLIFFLPSFFRVQYPILG